ncbi:MAG TPA: hypothetical protein VJ256_01665, partial [Dehalococcoidia bacterium]|nr:hypothetical protein [Dehalococcoidia bacterium]
IEYATVDLRFPAGEHGTFRVKAEGGAPPARVGDATGDSRPRQFVGSSPDGRWTATVAIEEPPKPLADQLHAAIVRIHIAPAGGGERKLAAELQALSGDLRAAVLDLQWSPDSHKVAFTLGIENACG